MTFKPKKRVGLYDAEFERESCGVGFVANIKGIESREVVKDALTILCNMDHRGARGSEPNTGDGAGILTGISHSFFKVIAEELFGNTSLEVGGYAVGNIFLPKNKKEQRACKKHLEKICKKENLTVLGWRNLPINPKGSDLGPSALEAMPIIEQIFIKNTDDKNDQEGFERKLYLVRKKVSNDLRGSNTLKEAHLFYINSLSSKTIVYKGMLTCDQLESFYPDLSNPEYTSYLAMVHSRFSTNTFPSWDRAMPNRMMSHNGEINTIKGNINWMKAREGSMHSDLYGDQITDLFPVMEKDCSDSGNFDNALEFLTMTGRSIEESILMMVPEAWQKKKTLSKSRKAYYEYHSNLMEPWDGPASITFTNGDVVGAVLDRNGLRPSRYYVTKDDRVIMASEVGALSYTHLTLPTKRIV